MNTFDLSLDLSKSRNVNPIRLRQGDLNGTTIRALIFDHGALADLSGTTARWVMRLPGGEEYYRKAATVDATACTVTVEVDETQAASVSGRCRGYFQILDGSTVIASTGDVLVEVLPDALEGASVAESYDTAIQDAIDALDAAVEAIPNTVEDVLEAHPEWTTTVQDGAVTDAKLYQGAGGILARNQRLMYRLDNLLAAALPEGDSATATDAAKTPLAGLALYGRSTQDGTPTPSAPVAIESVGAANLLDPSEFVGGTSKGLTVTYEGDGWIRVTGTVTGSSAGIVMMWGSSDTSVSFLDSPGDRQSFLIEDDGVLAENAIGIQIYGRDGDGNNQYGIYYDAGLKLLPVGKYETFLSRVCVYLNASATGRVVDGRVRLTLVSGHWPLYQHVPYGSAALLALGGNIVRGIDGEHTFTKTSSSAQVAWGGGADAVLPHLKAGTTLTVTYEAKASAAGTLTPYLGMRDESNLPASSWSASTVTVGTEWATYTRTGTLTADANLVWLTAGSATPSDTEINVRNLRVTLDGSTDYQPYTYTVTPIDLDGHELRSLPDGTRDELTVGADGRVTLVQRVGSRTTHNVSNVTDNGDGTVSFIAVGNSIIGAHSALSNIAVQNSPDNTNKIGFSSVGNLMMRLSSSVVGTTASGIKAWLDEHGVEILYALATPVTIDLGWTDAIPLCGPDLTAQAVPSAPFALTYERDLNVTLARLEAALAALA